MARRARPHGAPLASARSAIVRGVLIGWLRRLGCAARMAAPIVVLAAALLAPTSALASGRSSRPQVLHVEYSGHGKYESTLTLRSGGCTTTETESSDVTWATVFTEVELAADGRVTLGAHADVKTAQTGSWTFNVNVTKNDISCTTEPATFNCDSGTIGTEIVSPPIAPVPTIKASVFPATGKQPPILHWRIQAIRDGYDFDAENPQGSPNFCPTLGNPVPLFAGLVAGQDSHKIPDYLTVTLPVTLPKLRGLAVDQRLELHNIASDAQPAADQAPTSCNSAFTSSFATCTSDLRWAAFVKFERTR